MSSLLSINELKEVRKPRNGFDILRSADTSYCLSIKVFIALQSVEYDMKTIIQLCSIPSIDRSEYQSNNANSMMATLAFNELKAGGIHFSNLNVNVMLNVNVICISETKPDGPVLSNEVAIDDFDLIRTGYSRKGGGVACFTQHSVAIQNQYAS